MTTSFTEAAYLAASLLFVFALHQLRAPETSRRGVLRAGLAVLLAVAGTLLGNQPVRYDWIVAGIAMALVIPMAKIPERIALSHAFGGLAAALVGIADYARHGGALGRRRWPR